MIGIFLLKKNNKWRIICQYRDEETKKRRQKVLGTYEKKKDASAKMVEEQNKLNKNLFVVPKDITLDQYMNMWIELRVNSIERSTYIYYKNMIRTKIDNTPLGAVKLQDIAPMHIERFYLMLSKTLSNNTILKYHKMLKKSFEDAKKRKLVSVNPIDSVEAPLKSKKNVGKTLSKEDAIRYLEYSKNTMMELPINLALVLGLRASEICGLGLDKINF